MSSISDFHICHVPSDQEFGYVCEGPKYEAFADKLEAFVTATDDGDSLWGKRPFPFPNNTTLLVVGNSLMRQVFMNIACQYRDELETWIDHEYHQSNVMRRGTFLEVGFANGATMYLVTNHAMFYSPKWPKFLKELIGGEEVWQNLDFMVVGHLNGFAQAYNTAFMEIMREKTKQWEGANFETVEPPRLNDFARVFKDRPLIAVSLMADSSSVDSDYQELLQLKRRTEKRERRTAVNRTISIVHGRKYIKALGECGSDVWWNKTDCTQQPQMHRCIGARGGYPDVVAFDTIETIYQVVI